MPWTIEGGNWETATAFAEAKIIDATRNLQTGGGDICDIILDVDFDETELPERLDLITIKTPDGETWFHGPVVRLPASGNGGAEERRILLRSPWYFLENLTYTQPMESWSSTTPGEGEEPATVDTEPRRQSRVHLGIGDDGTRLTTGEAIEAIIDFAAAATGVAGVVKGTILTGFEAPVIEMTDAACSECILQLLRYHPDAVVYCNFDNAAGQIQVKKRADLGTLALPAAGSVSFSVEEREDLVPPGVKIYFESTHEVDGRQFRKITVDGYPDTTAADAVGGIHFTIPLQGRSITTQSQDVGTIPIPDVGDNDADAWRWIQNHFAGLEAASQADFTIGGSSFAQTIKVPVGADAEDFPEDYPRELVKGAVPEWIEEPEGEEGSPKACPTEVKIYLTYNGTDATLKELFPGDGRRLLITEIMGTTLSTKRYTRVAGSTDGETVPTGLAQAYYDALTTMQIQGTLNLTETECSVDLTPGKVLTLTGFGSAIVQNVGQSVAAGSTSLAFGPFNGALSPADFIDLQRSLARSLSLSQASGTIRTDAEASISKQDLKGSTKVPRNNDVSPGAGGGWTPAWLVTPGNKTIEGTPTAGVFVKRGIFRLSGSAVTVKLGSDAGADLDADPQENFLTVPATTEGGIYLVAEVDDAGQYSLVNDVSYVKWIADPVDADTTSIRHIELAHVNGSGVWNQTNLFNIEAARAGDPGQADNMRLWAGP